MSDQLKPGDTVRLKSGGPVMTIDQDLGNGYFLVRWFNDNNEPMEAGFPPHVLEKDEMY